MKYTLISDFELKSRGAYISVIRNGWKEDLSRFLKKRED